MARTLNAAEGYDTGDAPWLHDLHASPTAAKRPLWRCVLRPAPAWRMQRATQRRLLGWLGLLLLVVLAGGVRGWADGTLTFGQAADAAGIVGQAGHAASAGAKWQAKAPTGSSKQDVFIRLTLDSARNASLATHWPVSLLLAQWGLEHAWQLPDVYVQDGYNFGNSMTFDTPEGVCYGYGVAGDFCYAATQAQGLRIFEHVAALGFYDAVAPAAKSGGAVQAAQALGRSPWASSGYDNGNGPGSSLVAIMDDFGLYAYDK